MTNMLHKSTDKRRSRNARYKNAQDLRGIFNCTTVEIANHVRDYPKNLDRLAVRVAELEELRDILAAQVKEAQQREEALAVQLQTSLAHAAKLEKRLEKAGKGKAEAVEKEGGDGA